jgi:hypothetical protein
MKIKIFSAYYGNMPKIIENDIIVPIQGGASLQDNDLIKLKDSVSPEISKKNDMYNEFTVLYAIWKYYSKDLDYVGLCHYRRYFVLKKYKIIFEVIKRITKRPLFHIFFVNRTNLKLVKILKKNELIIPKLKKIDMSMKEYYAEKHIKKHYEIFENVIREEFKFLEKYLNFTSRRKAGYFLNMFIMKKDLFEEYCENVFRFLSIIERKIDVSEENQYQKRALGFLGERFTNLFYIYLIESKNVNKFKEMSIITIK